MTTSTPPYPPIEPYDCGLLDVGDGNTIYWEVCGNHAGKPAVVVHGGPGSGCSVGPRRVFDPAAYRVILFDQRGCGRSTPHASDTATDMSCNTTTHLIADMEKLRVHLGVERWLIFGSSWGSTLTLAYAQRYPDRVSEIVIVDVTTTSQSEIDWLYEGVGRFFPEAFERFRAGAAPLETDTDIVAAYAALMEHADLQVRQRAAQRWCEWEDAVLSAEPSGAPSPYLDREGSARLAFVRICTHYFSNGAWLEPDQIIRDAHMLAGIPGVLIHGQLDMSSPLGTAWQLARAWPDARLLVVHDAGHKGSDTMNSMLYEAIAGFAGQSGWSS